MCMHKSVCILNLTRGVKSLPFICLFIVTLYVKCGCESIKAAHHKQQVIHHLRREGKRKRGRAVVIESTYLRSLVFCVTMKMLCEMC